MHEPVAQWAAFPARLRLIWHSLRQRVPFVVALVLVALVARVIAAVVLDQFLVASGRSGFLGADDVNYDQVAWEQAQAWAGSGPAVNPANNYLLHAYTYTGAVVYLLVGHQPIAMKLLNCLLGALVAGPVFLTARQIFGWLAATFSGIAAAFFPSTFVWSLVNLKDAMFLCCVAGLFWLLTVLLATSRRWLILPLLVLLLLAGSLRLYVQALLALVIPFAAFVQWRTQLRHRWQIAGLLLIGCVVVLSSTGGWSWYRVTPEQLDVQRYLAALGAKSSYVALPTPVPTATASAVGGRGAVPPAVSPVASPPSELTIRTGRSLRGLITWLPTGILYALAAPFPWAARRAAELATVPEMLLWYAALGLAAVGIAAHWRLWRQYAHLLAYLAGMVLVFAISQGNYGTLVRSRGMIIPCMLMFSGAGAAWLQGRWRARRASGSGAALPLR